MPESSRGRNFQREVSIRHQKIKSLLKDGLGVSEVAKIVGITPKRVYVVAERWSLPTNPKIWAGSEDESTIARLVAAGWPAAKIGKLLNQSEKSVKNIISRIKSNPVLDSTAKRFGVDQESINSD